MFLLRWWNLLLTWVCCQTKNNNQVHQENQNQNQKWKHRDEESQLFHFIQNGIQLSNYQQQVFQCRILPILLLYRRKLRWVSFSYFLSRWFLQTASLLIPALIGTDINRLFWTIWSLSLFVGFMTNLVHMFRWDRKYYLLHRTYQMLIAESWYFIERIHHYETPNFQTFCESFEKIHHSYEQDENFVLKKSTSYLSPNESFYTHTPVRRFNQNDPLENDSDVEYLNPIQISPIQHPP